MIKDSKPIAKFHSIKAPPFIKCDNCGKIIKTVGKYVWRNGIIIFVHETYNETDKRCY